jgi:hypothetical protein
VSVRRPRVTIEEDANDTVGLAGWLYTDLLLGLTVVFLALAPVTFVSGMEAAAEPQSEETTQQDLGEITQDTLEEEIVQEDEPVQARCKGLAPEDGILKLELDAAQDDGKLLETAEARIEQGLAELDYPASSQFGFVIAFGQGPSVQIGAARDNAERLTTRLHELLPDRFDGASVRNYWSGAPTLSPVVELELFPWIDTCGEPS